LREPSPFVEEGPQLLTPEEEFAVLVDPLLQLAPTADQSLVSDLDRSGVGCFIAAGHHQACFLGGEREHDGLGVRVEFAEPEHLPGVGAFFAGRGYAHEPRQCRQCDLLLGPCELGELRLGALADRTFDATDSVVSHVRKLAVLGAAATAPSAHTATVGGCQAAARLGPGYGPPAPPQTAGR